MDPPFKRESAGEVIATSREERGIPTISIFVETATSWGRRVVAEAFFGTLAVEDPKMAVVMRFIQTKFREPINMPEILLAATMARRSLERKFRQTFGMSVIDRIRQIRVNEARLLLAATNDPITLIAEKCGFASYNYMGCIFQAETGVTPREYRAQFRARKL